MPIPDTGDDMRTVRLNLHAAAAAKALLAAPQFAVQKCLVYFQPGRQTGEKRDQGLAVRFPRSEVTKHGSGIVSDEWI
jgi:hypothetical protein